VTRAEIFEESVANRASFSGRANPEHFHFGYRVCFLPILIVNVLCLLELLHRGMTLVELILETCLKVAKIHVVTWANHTVEYRLKPSLEITWYLSLNLAPMKMEWQPPSRERSGFSSETTEDEFRVE